MRSSLARVLLALAGTPVALALAELGSRWLQPIRPDALVGPDGNALDDWLQPATHYRQVSSEYEALTTITLEGHRVPAPRGALDVVFLGDSFTFGRQRPRGQRPRRERSNRREAQRAGGWLERRLFLRGALERRSNLVRLAKYHFGPLLSSALVPGLGEERRRVALERTRMALADLAQLARSFDFELTVHLIHPVQDLRRGAHAQTLAALGGHLARGGPPDRAALRRGPLALLLRARRPPEPSGGAGDRGAADRGRRAAAGHPIGWIRIRRRAGDDPRSHQRAK